MRTRSTIFLVLVPMLFVLATVAGRSLAQGPPEEPRPMGSAAATATQVTIYASGDAVVDPNYPDTNYGSSDVLGVGICGEFTGNALGFLSFSTATIPSGAIIHSAQLRLYKTGTDAGPADVHVQRLTSSWAEGSVTWNTRPSAFYVVEATTNVGRLPGNFYTWDLTELVQKWVDGSVPNYGIQLSAEGGACKEFASREQDVAYRPRLVVSYTPATPTPVPDMRSLRLDGDGDYVEIPFADALNNFNAITIEAWVKRDANRCETVVGNGWKESYWLGFCNKVIRFYHKGYVQVDGKDPVPPGQWTHIAVTYDGTTRRYYINGKLDTETTQDNGPIVGTSVQSALFIGADRHGGCTDPALCGFQGLIDELRIWNVVRTQEEIQQTMYEAISGSKPGLVAVWSFDGQVLDGSGNGHHGALRGDAGFSPEGFPNAPTPTPTPPPPTATPTPVKGAIQGRVWEDQNHNRTPDPGEPGIPNVRLELRQGSVVLGSDVTGSDGRYRFDGLDPGTYTVDVDDSTIPWNFTWDTGADPATVSLGAGEVRDNVDFGYARAPTPTPTPTPTPRYDLVAEALEVTQGVQDLDNSVRLVAEKLTLVRFYARIDRTSATRSEPVTARLRLRKGSRMVEVDPVTNTRELRLGRDALAGRDDPYGAFLFILPYEFTTGNVTLTAMVDPDGQVREWDEGNNSVTRVVSFEAVPPLNVHLVRVQYRHRRDDLGVSGTVPPASTTDRATLYYWLIAGYPVSRVNLMDSVFNWNMEFVTDASGNTTPDPQNVFGVLNRAIENALAASDRRRSLPGSPIFRYGMVWDGVGDGDNFGVLYRGACCVGRTGSGPTGRDASRYGWGSWDTDGSFGDWYAAHELAHALGRGHVRCSGREAGPDTGYPYSNGRIGNGDRDHIYGYHIYRAEVYPGNTWSDVMSYCQNQWISDYTYEGIMDRLQGFARGARTPGQPADHLLVTGTIDPDSGRVELEPIFVVPDAPAEAPHGPGSYAIVLRNAEGQELARHAFTPTTLSPGPPAGDGGPDTVQLAFSERVPYVASTDRVEIQGPGGTVLKAVTAGSRAPTVTITAPTANTTFDQDTLRIAWTASDPDGDTPLYALVQYSDDNGQTWATVGLPTQGTEMDVPADNVFTSNQGRFRVLVSDGIHTGVAEVGPIVVPNQGPALLLLAPSPGATFLDSQTVVLQAFAYDRDQGTLSGDRMVWRSSRDGELGKGDTLPVTGLSVGEHTITVRVDDGQGGVAERSVTIRIVDDPDELGDRRLYLPLVQRPAE